MTADKYNYTNNSSSNNLIGSGVGNNSGQPYGYNPDSRNDNEQAWNTGAYAAWLNRFGSPQEAAARLQQDPLKRIGSISKHLAENYDQLKIINLLGSNGMKAVALALLGADVTVADFSADNQRYATELAEAANVHIRYVLSDVLHLQSDIGWGSYDIVLMELGILHYFEPLQPLFQVVCALLKPGGKLVLQDFHPITTKLISSKGSTAQTRKHKVTGDYFDDALEIKEVSFAKYLPADGSPLPTVKLRNWTLGEIVTAAASGGLTIQTLEELPNLSSDVYDKGIPKLFTLVAVR